MRRWPPSRPPGQKAAMPSYATSTWETNSSSRDCGRCSTHGGALLPQELNGGADAWGTARHVLAGDEDAIEGTGADFAAVPSGAYPALEDSLSGLGFSLVHDDGPSRSSPASPHRGRMPPTAA